MYNGLTTADKGALLDAKAREESHLFIERLDRVFNIDLALAQIAEMELTTNSTPLTWNERINQMTVEEKADVAVILSKRCARALEKESCPDLTCWQCFIEFLNSPYTEGETK